jgi:hypothetical protein
MVVRMNEKPTIRRKRVKHEQTFEERLLDAARKARDSADRLPPGEAQETLLRLARESEAAVKINEWITSPRIETRERASDASHKRSRQAD